MLKAAVVSPMPRVKATAAAAVCPGALASILNPYRISRQNELIENPPIRAPQGAAPSSGMPAVRPGSRCAGRPDPQLVQSHYGAARKIVTRVGPGPASGAAG